MSASHELCHGFIFTPFCAWVIRFLFPFLALNGAVSTCQILILIITHLRHVSAASKCDFPRHVMCLPVIIIPPAPLNISTRSSHQDILLTTPPASYKLNCRSANTNHFTNNNPKHTTTSDPQLATHQKDEKKRKKKETGRERASKEKIPLLPLGFIPG